MDQQEVGANSFEESLSRSTVIEEDVCRLQILHPKNNCDICSDSSGEIKTIGNVCLNTNCMISIRRGYPPSRFRIHPECFHYHLQGSYSIMFFLRSIFLSFFCDKKLLLYIFYKAFILKNLENL